MEDIQENTNGESVQIKVVEVVSNLKPWHAAGFKSREEWRASKRAQVVQGVSVKKEAKPNTAKRKEENLKSAAKKETKPKTEAKTESKAKTKKEKTKVAGGPKHKYPSTTKEKEAAHARMVALKKAMAKREEPNNDEARLWKAIPVGGDIMITDMARLFPGHASAKSKRKVCNALRWLEATKKFKRIGRGTYRRDE